MSEWNNGLNQCCVFIKSTKRNDYHYCDVIMGAIASSITGLIIFYSIVYSGADQRKHQSSASLAFVREIHRWPVNSPHKWPVTRKMFPFDDVIMFIVSLSPGSPTSWSMCRWVTIRAAKMHKVSTAISNDVICFANVTRNQWILSRQHISTFNHHCLGWRPTSVRCYDIRKCINAQIRVAYIYGTGT